MKYIAGLILCCVLGVITFANAVGAAQSWSWDAGVPIIARSDAMNFNLQPFCPTYQEKVKIEGRSDTVDMCLFGDNSLRIGSGFIPTLDWRAVVAFPFDDQFHILTGICEGVEECLYAPDQDALVDLYPVDQYHLSARVFRTVSQRIHQSFNPTLGRLQYAFDTDHPAFTTNNIDGRALFIGSMAVSNNGQWLVFEIRDFGLATMNLQSGIVKRIVASGPLYGYGLDPIEELAIDNSGSSVALMGQGMGVSIIAINSECGAELTVPLLRSFAVGKEDCPTRGVDTRTVIPSFFFASHPSFNDDGGQLNFYALSRTEQSRLVSLRAVGYQAIPALEYMALGDSFSSGEGETDDDHYKTDTNEPFEKCHVSDRSYPFLLMASMKIPIEKGESVACSGARTQDIIGGTNYQGQKDSLGTGGLQLSRDDIAAAQMAALTQFYPGRIHQEDFIKRYEPSIVTIGIGGNDVGFMDKLKTCLMPGTCEWVSSPEMLARTGDEIQRLFMTLVSTYKRLQHDSPLTKIYAVGYPQVINFGGVCDPITTLLLDDKERRFIREGISYINQVIRAAAQKTGAVYIDVENSLATHELCDFTPFAMNGLRLGDDIGPKFLPLLKIIGRETFHPTPDGHQLMAVAMIEKFGNLLTYECTVFCEASSLDPPPIPYYWGSETSGIIQKSLTFAPEEMSSVDRTIEVTLPDLSLAPDSVAHFEFHSESTVLGEVTVNDRGGLEARLLLPTDTKEGYHTLHLFGTSYDGRLVDIYQIISYKESANVAVIATLPSSSSRETLSEAGSVLGIQSFKDQHAFVKNAARTLSHPLIVGIGGVVIVAAGLVIVIICKRKTKSTKKWSQDPGG